MNKKVLIAVLTALFIVVCLFFYIGSRDKGADTDTIVTDDVVTLDWYIDAPWYSETWGEDIVSQKITEETGVSVRFITPEDNEGQMIESFIMSDSLPDLITINSSSQYYLRMVNEKKLYSLDGLARLYSPDFFDVTEEVCRDYYTAKDGSVYAYPNAAITPKDAEKSDNLASNLTFLVRKDIYEALGEPDMTTPEGFCDAIRRADEMYSETDDGYLIPVGGAEFTSTGSSSFSNWLQDLLAVPYEKDGIYYDRNTDEEYIRWLKVFRQLFEEGYIKTDVFVDQRTQISEKVQQGRYFCLIYERTDIAEQQAKRYESDPDSVYIAVDGPKNSDGDDYVLPLDGVRGWMVSCISKKCKDPIRAIKFFTYLLSEEGQKLTYLGIEGETYEEKDGHITLFPEVEKLHIFDRRRYNALYGSDYKYWMLMNTVMCRKWLFPIAKPARQLEEWTYPYSKYTAQYDIVLDEGSSAEHIYKRISELWGDTLMELMTAKSEKVFDKILKNYVTLRDSYGYQKLVREQTKKMNENMEVMGIE